MPILPASAQKILTRHEIEERQIVHELQLRAIELPKIELEEMEARAEVQRLIEADRKGKLIREKRIDDEGNPLGWDTNENQIIEIVPDSERLSAARANLEVIRQKKAAWALPLSRPPRLTATKIKHELAKYAGKTLTLTERPKVTLRKGERMGDALARLRAESLELKAERRAVEKAPLTKAEVKVAMAREVDKAATRLPGTLPMFHGTGIQWPMHNIVEGSHRTPDAIALIAFLFGDQLKAALSKVIDVNAGAFPDAMSREDQADRLAELDSEIEAAERLEAAAVEAIIAEGGEAYHRPDADILAVLSLTVE